MRTLVLALLIAGCSQEPAPKAAEQVLYAGEGRDRLCLKGERGGFIVYGEGDANCSARGRVDRAGNRVSLVPEGDPDCRIDAKLEGDRLAFGVRSDACAYYCGPGANYEGRGLTKSASASPAIDFAGDPLC